MECYGVIMAGGTGSRFWPLSRKKVPKQFLKLTGNEKMLNETIVRIHSFMELERIFIVTNEMYADSIKKLIPEKMPEENIIQEPASRNTAACIAYAAIELLEKYGNGIMCVFPSDHYIENTEAFSKVLLQAALVAEEKDSLVTIGIEPEYPATGYGYIRYDKTETTKEKDVIKFVEKPQYEEAEEYIKSKEYVWNSGIYVWKISKILQEIMLYMPELYECIKKIKPYIRNKRKNEFIKSIYQNMPNISIDYGVMEHSKNVKVIPSSFGWNDIGSWESLKVIYPEDSEGNVAVGDNVQIDTRNSIIYSEGRMIATLGVEDMIIVETQDAILVCHKDRAQEIRKITEELKKKKRQEYL